MGLRSALFGRPLRTVLVALVAVLALVGAAGAVGVLGVPGVADVQNSFDGVNDSTTVIRTDLTVNNPNPVGVSLGSLAVNYSVSMNGLSMATGEKRGLAVGSGNTTLTLHTRMDNRRIPAWWVSHVEGGERTSLRVDATVSGLLGQRASVTPVTRTIETDIIGQFDSEETRPVNANVALVEDPVAYINRTSASWGDVSAAETEIDVSFVVYNPKEVPLVLTGLGYNVSMNELDMGQGTTDREYVIPPGETRTVEATVVLNNPTLDEWWVSHLERNQVTDLRIEFAARVGPEGATVEIPLRGLEYEKRIETDFFGTKPADPPNDGERDPDTRTGTDTAAETTTTDRLGATTVADREETTAGETTTTTTDDGGLL